MATGMFIFTAACAFWVTSGAEEIDSIIDPIAERVALQRAKARGELVPTPENVLSSQSFNLPLRLVHSRHIYCPEQVVEEKANPVSNGSLDAPAVVNGSHANGGAVGGNVVTTMGASQYETPSLETPQQDPPML